MTELLYVIRGSYSEAYRPTRRMHRHNFLELHYVVSGRGICLVEQTEIVTEPGMVVIYNADEFHAENQYNDEPVSFFSIGLGGLHEKSLPVNHLIAGERHHAVHLEQYTDLFSALVDALYRELRLQEGTTSARCERMTDLMLDLIRTQRDARPDQDTPDPEMSSGYLCDRIRQYLCYHYEEDITLEGLARMMHTSPSTISHMFKEQYRIPPLQYLQRIRIGEAQTLLGSTDLSIREIALRVGYNSPDNMYLAFQKNVGMSPSRYRASQRGLQTFSGD